MKKELTKLKVYLQRNDKIMTNSLRLAFPLLLPFPAADMHNINLIYYRWDGEPMLE